MEENAVILTNEQKHLEKVKKANKLYILTLIFCGAAVLGALVWAVLDSVFMGLLLGICAIIIYMALTSNILYRSFGISYKSDTGRLTVTQLYGKGREEVFLPERIIMLTLTEIGDRAFAHKSSAQIRTVHLPATLEVIGKDVFDGCESLRTLCFGGTREAFLKIQSATDLSCYKVVCTDDPVEQTEEMAEPETAEQVAEEATR